MKSPSWRTIEEMESARWLKFARAHPEHPSCAIALRRGRVDKSLAIVLGRVAAANQWPIPRAGRPYRS